MEINQRKFTGGQWYETDHMPPSGKWIGGYRAMQMAFGRDDSLTGNEETWISMPIMKAEKKLKDNGYHDVSTPGVAVSGDRVVVDVVQISYESLKLMVGSMKKGNGLFISMPNEQSDYIQVDSLIHREPLDAIGQLEGGFSRMVNECFYLAKNAREFAEDAAGHAGQGGDDIAFYVSDDGKGMSLDLRYPDRVGETPSLRSCLPSGRG